jgi:hypothetical protein
MTYHVHESTVQISPVHRAAIGKEIGERLRSFLNQRSVRLPSSLVKLMQRLRRDRSRSSTNPRT